MTPDLQFDPATHTYQWRGKVVPSVTQVLKDTGLIDDAWYTPESARRGQAVHVATELDDRGELDESTVHEKVMPYLLAWRKFRAETGFTPVLIEQWVYNQSAQYAGTVDRVGSLCGQEVILDIKTGTAQPWHAWQLAAYQYCFDGFRKYLRRCVYLKDDGTYKIELFKPENMAADYQIFQYARFTWQHQARRVV